MEKINVKQVKCVKDFVHHDGSVDFKAGKYYDVIESKNTYELKNESGNAHEMYGFYFDNHFEIITDPEPLDFTKILKVGDRVYSVAHGYVVIYEVSDSGCNYPIGFKHETHGIRNDRASKDGKLYVNSDAEQILFPSKENRDWSTWKTANFTTLQK